MKNFKKALCLVLALAMTVAMLAACAARTMQTPTVSSAKENLYHGR